MQHLVQFVLQSVIADSTLAGRDVKMTSRSGCPFSPMPLEASIVGHIAVVCKVLCNCDGVCVRVPAGNMRGRDGGVAMPWDQSLLHHPDGDVWVVNASPT